METTLQEILQARECRAAQQQSLLKKYGRPVICFTMNIPGPEKDNALIRWGFDLGNRWLKIQLSDLTVLHSQMRLLSTGCESYFVVDAPAQELKHRTVQIEDSAPVARLFDMDVLDIGGKKLERTACGYPQRKCLLCDRSAHVCGRSRAHPVASLQAKTTELLREAMVQEDCAHIARLAQQSLLFEVCTTPKPGLVDCRNNGSHQDMNIFTFMASSAALVTYFTRCVQLGAENRHIPPQQVFDLLRFQGKLAEHAMYSATEGVNTHKGSIFSLGILCAAAGRLEPQERTPDTVLTLCKRMTQGLVKQELSGISQENAATAGESLFVKHGITGVRGQAEAGFPQVLQVGLPVLETGLHEGLSLNDAGCATLLALLASTTDTNLIHRSSLQKQQTVAADIGTFLSQHPYPSREMLENLDDTFIGQNLSPGGSADLLAITYFLHALQKTPSAEALEIPIEL